MTMQKIITTIFDAEYWRTVPVTYFVSPSYPYQFMRKVLLKLEQEQCIPVPRSRVQLSTQDAKALLPLLQQTVLGQANFFWLGDVDDSFATKQRDLLLAGLDGYAGENRIALFVQEVPAKSTVKTIQLPLEITATDAVSLLQLFNPKILDNSPKLSAVEALFSHGQQHLPLNLFMTIIDSLELMQVKNLEQFVRYVTPMLPLNAELSSLSQAFFKRDRSFFTTWSHLSAEYPPVFWLAFWQDQWWRAFHLITFANKKNIVLAKKMGFKLPYSFVTREWQQYSATYFQKLLAQLYAIDYNIKRGHSFCFFDFLYAQHFVTSKK
jgi:hypothetical protein